jgi:hypothetical protein
MEVFKVFKKDNDLIPRTYSIKSYRRRKTISFGAAAKYFAIFAVVVLLIGFGILMAYHLI